MRSDMAQVLIERPRAFSSRKYRGQRRANSRVPLDGAPRREGTGRRARGGEKEFTDLFGPLRRFLLKNVGRPWNKVYSEVCARADLRNPAQRQLRHHIFDFVEANVMLIDGVPHTANGRWPLDGSNPYIDRFYVCPRTGLLRHVRPRKPRR